MSNSSLVYFDRKNIDLKDLYSALDMPFEFLKDASYWLEASKMESFLAEAQKIITVKHPEITCFVSDLGKKSAELRSWGALDGVLRMLKQPQDIFSKPERFISYFISPAPPIASIKKQTDSISFQLPISQEEYPLSLAYLKAAMESLPTFVGQDSFKVEWSGNEIFISWSQQEFVFDEDLGSMSHPELLGPISLNLENSQKELENKNKELTLKNIELESVKVALEKTLQQKQSFDFEKISCVLPSKLNDLNAPLSYVQTNLHRMQDYMARSQQLITLLVGQGRKDKQVQEAMHRVDWDYVLKEFPNVVNEAYEGLQKIRTKLDEFSSEEETTKQVVRVENKSNEKQQTPLC